MLNQSYSSDDLTDIVGKDTITKPAAQIATVKPLINGQFVESRTTQWRDVVDASSHGVNTTIGLK